MDVPLTLEQIRSAALEALAEVVPAPVGVKFDNYHNLKIGVRAALAAKGILPPQPPSTFLADDALSKTQEITYKRVYDALITEGTLTQHHGTDRFVAVLLPAPFSDQWLFLESLGGGGQGTARRVKRKSDGTSGVLKVPHSTEAVARERFRREVAILQETEHPAIVRLLDVNVDPAKGALGYVTPLGIPLDKYWAARSPALTSRERYDMAFNIVARISAGLNLLHSKGVVHRDLKPENIILIGDQPLVIDFGVVLRPGEDRLSVVDQRVVANGFATPASAHYGLHEGRPAWDCLGLAWIYGFLLGEGQRPKQFHWKYHRLVDEPRQLRAKAVLAACSHEQTVPPNAGAFVELLNQYRLGTPDEPVTIETGSLEAAIAAHIEAKAASAIRVADEAELAEVAIQILEQPLTDLRASLNRRCVGNTRLPVTQNGYQEHAMQMPPSPTEPMGHILRQVANSGRDGSNSERCIFSCRCGSGPRHFEIGVFLAYSSHYTAEALHFRIFLWCRTQGGKPPQWPEALFLVRKDCCVQHTETNQIGPMTTIADLAFHWMGDPRRWQAIG